VSKALPLWSLGFVVGLAALTLRIAFFHISTTHLPPIDDEAQTMLLAKQIREGARPLLVPGQPYEFPLESYLLAPFVSLLPVSAFGTRVASFVVWLFIVLGQLHLCRRLADPGSVWPAQLLVLFPSAYALSFQSAVAWPQYASLATLSWLLIWLVSHIERARGSVLSCTLAGLLSGLVLSNYLLSFSLIIVAGLAICVSDGWRHATRSTPSYVTGLSIGLIPYFLGARLVAAEQYTVLGRRTWGQTLSRAWRPTMDHALPGAMGISLPSLTDFHAPLQLVPWLAPWFAVLFLAILLAVTGYRLARSVRLLSRRRWPTLTVIDVLVGATWLSLLFFAMSQRAHSRASRYLLPVVWFSPLVVSYLHARGPRLVRAGIACFVLALAGYNLFAAAVLMRHWSQSGFASTHADTPPLEPALRVLETLGWRHCYAPFWLANRITFESRERVVCSQPYNERFYGWPLPYRDLVDAAPTAPYVLFDGKSIRFKRQRFENDLRTMGVSYEVTRAGVFYIYHDFAHPPTTTEQALRPEVLAIATSHNAGDAARLNDGRTTTAWSSRHVQEVGMWLTVLLREPHSITAIELDYGNYPFDRPLSLQVSARDGAEWRQIARGVSGLDPFTFANGRPVYGAHVETVRFPAVWTDGLRIAIARPAPDRLWEIGEIRIRSPRGPAPTPGAPRPEGP